MSGELKDKVAVITGGAAGIGKAIAIRFGKEGANVVVADINEVKGRETVKLINDSGKKAFFIKVDCSDEESIKSCMKQANEWGGGKGIQVLINNAAAFVFGHLGGAGSGSGTFTDKDITIADWSKVLNTNIIGYAKCIEHVVPYMKMNELTDVIYDNDQGEGIHRINAGSRGTIVNMASVSSFIAQPEFCPYNVSKGGIAQLTRCTAMDLSKFKIRVNSIAPDVTETPASYNHMRSINLTIEEGRKEFSQYALLKRMCAPDEVANGAYFLASDQSSFMTGAMMVMDGGRTL